MKVDYNTLISQIYTNITSNSSFDPTDDTNRLVNYVARTRVILANLSPYLNIWIDGKLTESHRAIGYNPFPIVRVMFRIVTMFPGEATPSALLTAMGISKIENHEQADEEILRLLDALEEHMRATANRKLGITINSIQETEVGSNKIYQLKEGDNKYINVAELNVDLHMRLT